MGLERYYIEKRNKNTYQGILSEIYLLRILIWNTITGTSTYTDRSLIACHTQLLTTKYIIDYHRVLCG